MDVTGQDRARVEEADRRRVEERIKIVQDLMEETGQCRMGKLDSYTCREKYKERESVKDTNTGTQTTA